MPTPSDIPPHRILPLILALAIACLVLIGMAGSSGAPDTSLLPDGAVPIQLARHAADGGWGDDALQTGLPVLPADDDESGRRLRAVRIVVGCDIREGAVLSRPAPHGGPVSTRDSLMDSLLLSRPPPADPARS